MYNDILLKFMLETKYKSETICKWQSESLIYKNSIKNLIRKWVWTGTDKEIKSKLETVSESKSGTQSVKKSENITQTESEWE